MGNILTQIILVCGNRNLYLNMNDNKYLNIVLYIISELETIGIVYVYMLGALLYVLCSI